LIWLLLEPPTAAGRRGEAKFVDFFFWVKFEFWGKAYVRVCCRSVWHLVAAELIRRLQRVEW
jgi:hypothetical protein